MNEEKDLFDWISFEEITFDEAIEEYNNYLKFNYINKSGINFIN